MSPAERLLATVTSARWLGMSDEERAVVYDAIHELVPARLLLASNVGHEPKPFPFFIDQQTQLGFYLVFGQRFVMGASGDEIAEGERVQRAALERDDWLAIDGFFVQPAHEVDAAPFFVAEDVLSDVWWIKIGVRRPTGKPMPETARDAIPAQGWRVPSEAELDFLRVLATHSELPRLDDGQCEDSWHDDYTGAPSWAEPWGAGREVIRYRDHVDRPEAERRRGHDFYRYRPVFSLLPAALGYSVEAIAARAAEPAMRARR